MIRLGEHVGRGTLTVNQRALLHLFERTANKDIADAAFPLTQEGIARALRIRVNHVSRAMRTLEGQNCLSESTARVRGEVRKRKVYLITPEGHSTAQALAMELNRAMVTVRDERGAVRDLAMGEARKLAGGPYSLTEILSNVDREGLLDLARVTPERGRAAMSHHEQDRPSGESFFGRVRELAAIAEWAASTTPALLVVGPRGIGKTALVSKALEALEPERHTLWHTAKEGAPLEGMTRSLGAFLASVGRSDLSSRLLERAPRIDEVEGILERDWPTSRALLVLDDADRAPDGVARMLIGVMRKRGGKLLLTAETPLLDGARLRESIALQVLPIGGLEKQECRKLAPRGMPNEEFEKIYRLSRGNPLSIKLLAADSLEGLEARFSAEERALLRVLRLRQESS